MTVYGVLEKVKEKLVEDGICNLVTSGNLSEHSLQKNTLYPHAHVTLGNVRFLQNIMEFDLFVICMDLIDINKEIPTDLYKGNDNEHDAFNTTATILSRLTEIFRRGDVRTDGYHLIGDPSAEPFYDDFADKVSGFTMTLTIQVVNNIDAC